MNVKLVFEEAVMTGIGRSLKIELEGPSEAVDPVIESIRETVKEWKGWKEL